MEKTPRGLQALCDGCGENLDTNHALACKNGGLVYQRHNESRDENCDLHRKAGFSQVLSEPIIMVANADGFGELRGDWSVRGFWVPQRVAVFDTRIFNANAPCTRPSLLKLLSPSIETKRKPGIILMLITKEGHSLQLLQLAKEFFMMKQKPTSSA